MILALRRRMKENHEFKVNLSYRVRFCLKTKVFYLYMILFPNLRNIILCNVNIVYISVSVC